MWIPRATCYPNNHSSKHRRQQSLGGALNHHSVSIRGRSPRSPTETRFEVRLTRTLTRIANQVVWHLLTSTESRNHQEPPNRITWSCVTLPTESQQMGCRQFLTRPPPGPRAYFLFFRNVFNFSDVCPPHICSEKPESINRF